MEVSNIIMITIGSDGVISDKSSNEISVATAKQAVDRIVSYIEVFISTHGL